MKVRAAEYEDDDGRYTLVYEPGNYHFYCSPQKLLWVSAINGEGHALNEHGESELLEGWEGYMDASSVEALRFVEQDFESLEDALEYWQGNWPF